MRSMVNQVKQLITAQLIRLQLTDAKVMNLLAMASQMQPTRTLTLMQQLTKSSQLPFANASNQSIQINQNQIQINQLIQKTQTHQNGQIQLRM